MPPRCAIPAAASGVHAVPRQHPRLLGSVRGSSSWLRSNRRCTSEVAQVARVEEADEHAKIVSLSLVAAIEQDSALGRQAVDMALRTIRGPIKTGHDTFGHDLARCAIAYDLCHDCWTEEDAPLFMIS